MYTFKNFSKDNPSSNFSSQEQSVNNSIDNSFKSALNFKIGAEYVYEKVQFRVGYNINGAAFADKKDNNDAISFGIGLRLERFYIDAAYRLLNEKNEYLPYSTTTAHQPIVSTEETIHDALLTIGFRF